MVDLLVGGDEKTPCCQCPKIYGSWKSPISQVSEFLWHVDYLKAPGSFIIPVNFVIPAMFHWRFGIVWCWCCEIVIFCMHPGRYLSWATSKRSKRPLRTWSPFICQEHVAQVKPRVRLILVRARVFACVIRSTLMYFASGWRNSKPPRKSARMKQFSHVRFTRFLTTGFWMFLVYLDLSCGFGMFWPQSHDLQELTMTSKQCNPYTTQYILADIWAGPPASAPSALCEHGPLSSAKNMLHKSSPAFAWF